MLTAIDEIERKKRVAASIHPTWLPEFGNNCNSFHHSFLSPGPTDRRTNRMRMACAQRYLLARNPQNPRSAMRPCEGQAPGDVACASHF